MKVVRNEEKDQVDLGKVSDRRQTDDTVRKPTIEIKKYIPICQQVIVITKRQSGMRRSPK